MQILLTLLHVIVSVLLILVVLLQTGKRADLAGAFGGGGSQTAFGARGAATVLSKATTVAAVIFMLTSLGLALLSSSRETPSGSVLDQLPAGPAAPAPGQPPAPVPPPGE
jgi:preprotein translocase subunit SecG